MVFLNTLILINPRRPVASGRIPGVAIVLPFFGGERQQDGRLLLHARRVEGRVVGVATSLLRTKWDFIHFTGSVRVGKLVALAAAQHMTPHVLELGGKAPAVVHDSACVREAARRIINSKALNCGQTCTIAHLTCFRRPPPMFSSSRSV